MNEESIVIKGTYAVTALSTGAIDLTLDGSARWKGKPRDKKLHFEMFTITEISDGKTLFCALASFPPAEPPSYA